MGTSLCLRFHFGIPLVYFGVVLGSDYSCWGDRFGSNMENFRVPWRRVKLPSVSYHLESIALRGDNFIRKYEGLTA